ncbi:MAG: carbon storage regulator [Pseudomonadota bacterium]|nr:carbon storage regulator [Pseudomonadota bacterium]
MLKLDIRIGESVSIGDNVVLRLEKKSGQLARIAIEADPSLKIQRGEPAPAPLPPRD